MANTRYLTVQVENHVRSRLAEIHGQAFTKKMLRLVTGGTHEFDAVSADGRFVASIKASSLSSGILKAGQVRSSVSELYYLSLVNAQRRVLILTSRPFFEKFLRKVDGALAPGLGIECVDLPDEMQSEVARVVADASREVSPLLAREAIEEEIT